MTLGLAAFTLLHVAVSLAGLGSGFVVMFGLLNARRLDRWTAIFLGTTLATSVSGFGFPFERFLPSHAVGLVSIAVLAAAIAARYAFHLASGWRAVYVVGAVVALQLNMFVLIAQLFLKVPVLRALAPTQTEPPFVVAQLVALSLFVALGIAAVIRFTPQARGADVLRHAGRSHGVSPV